MNERFETFTLLIHRISRDIRRIKNQEMAEYQLRSAHISCLYYLYTLRRATAAELCEYCEEDKATISRAVDFLETNGYLLCESKNAKRYKSPLLLTEKGREVGKKIHDRIMEILDAVGSELSEEERRSFYRSLSRISENLHTIAEKRRNPYDE